jgi:hypothetical protein
MSSSYFSKSGVKVKVYPYENFMGIDTSRDKGAMDTGENQHLLRVTNAFVDWRGAIIKDYDVKRRGDSEGIVVHVAFFGRNLAAWARRDGGGITLTSERGHTAVEVFARDSVITSTTFNNKLVVASRNQQMYQYDGGKWEPNKSKQEPKPAYVTAVSSRLIMAGFQNSGTELWMSRVDDESVMPGDEDPATLNVTKAMKIDIRNIIGTADQIMGLGVFEQNILAVLCQDKTILYSTNANYEAWQLADRSNINVGTISHNTLAVAGQDLLFCSRSGVHTVSRSRQNGISIYQQTLSTKIDDLYRALVKSVPNKEEISAFYDQDAGQYNIFFPQTDYLSKRLTLTFNRAQDDEPRWSMGDFISERCGTRLGGITILGTSGGVVEVGEKEDVLDLSPDMEVATPILWHGSMNDQKQSHSILIQAIGTGVLEVEAYDENGRKMSSMIVELAEQQTDGTFYDVPLPAQYERKFEHRYRGVQLVFKSRGSGSIKIVGFAIFVRSEQ